MNKIEIKNYPDGGKYVIGNNSITELTYRINSYEDLFLLKSIKDACPNLEEITIPCMFQQQHDKKFNPNESFELKLVCEFINSLNFKKIKVFHPHSDVTPALLNNCEIIDNTEFIKQVIYNELYSGPGFPNPDMYNNLVLMFSDADGFKPLMKLCKQINWQGETYFASKAREKDKLIQVIDNNKDIVCQLPQTRRKCKYSRIDY